MQNNCEGDEDDVIDIDNVSEGSPTVTVPLFFPKKSKQLKQKGKSNPGMFFKEDQHMMRFHKKS